MFDLVMDFLNDNQNQETLTWLGGGCVVVAGGVWTAFKFFLKPTSNKSETNKPSSQSNEFLVDGDRNVVGEHVTIDKSTTNVSGSKLSTAIALVLLCLGALFIGSAYLGNSVTADCGSLATGGDISGSEITIQNNGDCE